MAHSLSFFTPTQEVGAEVPVPAITADAATSVNASKGGGDGVMTPDPMTKVADAGGTAKLYSQLAGQL